MSDIGVGSLGAPTANNEFQSEALQNLDKDAFLQLLVAQMRYQNPMSPVDSQQYLAQAAQYASVEQLENMATAQAELRSMQMVNIATDLVGQEVTALDGFTGQTVTGTVTGVRFGVEPVLIVDGVEVALSAVISVGEMPELDAGPQNDALEGDGEDGLALESENGVEADDGAVQENDVEGGDGPGGDGFEVPVGPGPESAPAVR